MSGNNQIQTQDDIQRRRITLGKYATDLLLEHANDGKITGTLLDDVLQNMPQKVRPEASVPDWLKDQLQVINTNIVTLRYMVLALAAETNDEIELTLKQLNTRMNALQTKSSEEAGLDHTALERIQTLQENMRTQQEHHAIAPEKEKISGRGM